MKPLDGSQKSQSVNCENLEGEIEDAVNKYLLESLTKRGRWLFNIIIKPIQWYLSLSKKISERFFNVPSRKAPIVFDSKRKEECEYIQKYAEIRISYYTTILAIIIFVIAIGLSYFITFYSSNIISSVAGAIMAIISSLALIVVIPKYGIYCRIVLDAEKRILIISEGSIEPNQSQATTNTQPQAHENTLSKSQNIGQIEFIKARLDFLKIMISAFTVAMLGLSAYYFQSQKPDVIYALVVIIVLCVPLFISYWLYRKTADELKDLP